MIIVSSILIISSLVRYQFTHKVLHPGGQGRQAIDKVGGDDRSLIRIGQDRPQPSEDAPTVVWIRQGRMEPVQRLDHPHCRPIRPE